MTRQLININVTERIISNSNPVPHPRHLAQGVPSLLGHGVMPRAAGVRGYGAVFGPDIWQQSLDGLSSARKRVVLEGAAEGEFLSCEFLGNSNLEKFLGNGILNSW